MTPFQQLYLGLGAKEKTYVDDLFNTYVYVGDGTPVDITTGIDLSKHGGLVWAKARHGNYGHYIADTARGGQKNLRPYNDAAEGTDSGNYGLKTFNTDGHSWGNDGSWENNLSMVNWTFRKSKGFFDIVTYTGNGSNRTIAHSLGSVPGCIIVKRLDNTGEWRVYHRGNNLGTNPEQYCLRLNQNNVSENPGAVTTQYWNNTAPTDSVFTVGTHADVNANTATYIAYIFAHDDQSFGDSKKEVIKCGSYTGNNNNSGPSIDLGWEPQMVLIKSQETADDWVMFDNLRGLTVGGYNDKAAFPNTTSTPAAGDYLEPLPDGFKLNTTSDRVNNNSKYVYIAIRRPDGYVGKPAKVGTDAFTMDVGHGTSTKPNMDSGFIVDFTLTRDTGNTSWPFWTGARMLGQKYQPTHDNVAEANASDWSWDYNNGWMQGGNGASVQSWMWKRGKGFDFVPYLGNSTAGLTIKHNLGVAPEMIWVRRRESASFSWTVYHAGIANAAEKYMELNTNSSVGDQVNRWNDTAPTSTVFSVGTHNSVNGGGDKHMAMLFASVPGISKVGNYTGDGGTSNAVSCGFQPRFLLIKRVNGTGNWKIWDSLRGNNMLRLDATNANTNDVLRSFSTSGFTLISPDATVNASGENYIFYAHA